jgi:hypothetical protein
MDLGTAATGFQITRLTGASFIVSTPNQADPMLIRSIRPKRATTDPGNQCGTDKQTRSENHLSLLLQCTSAPVRLLTLDQVRMRVDGRAVRLDTIKEVLESVLRDVPRRDDDVLVRRMVKAR